MDYTKINAEFVEKFGELEKLCGDIYSQKHGVSCYIDDMISKSGERYVLNWEYHKKRLKDVRYKRNKLTHGEVGFSENFAQKEDIDFIQDFINLIFKREDPLSLYNKKVNKKVSVNIKQSQNTVIISKSKKTNFSDVLLITGIIILVIIIACLIFNNQ